LTDEDKQKWKEEADKLNVLERDNHEASSQVQGKEENVIHV